MDFEKALPAVNLLGEIFGWPEELTSQLLLTFDSPHTILMHNFVYPYLRHFRPEKMVQETSKEKWLTEPMARFSLMN